MRPSIKSDLGSWLSYIESIHPVEIELGLERLKVVSRRLGIGQSAPFVFTVGGTNGKGTTTAVLSSLAVAAQKSVGWYSSPHLFEFNERIRINGHAISSSELVVAFDAVENARKDVSLSYFEFTTLAAFYLFESKNLDVWVLEIGLGGRLDAVNIIDPDISVVTNVGLDHQGFLGDTLSQIAVEKAGIAREGKPMVLGSHELPDSFYEVCSSVGAVIYRFGEQHSICDGKLSWQGGELINSNSSVPDSNAVAALQAFYLSGMFLSEAQAAEAINKVFLPGRLQKLHYKGHTVVVDVGHNPHAGAYLASQLAGDRYHVILGMLADKDVVGFVKSISGITSTLSVVDLNVPRGLSSLEMAQKLESDALLSYQNMADCLIYLSQNYPGEPFFIGGSFYTVCGAISILENDIGT